MMDGILVINKPKGITSHDVVLRIRRKLKNKKVGHAGTLDPLATGVLVLLLGKATKLSNTFIDHDKAYRATLILGTTTDSADTEGKIMRKVSYEGIAQESIEKVFEGFQGPMEQIPPMFSAVKYQGRKLYELAREGMVVKREPRKIVIHKLLIEKIDLPEVQFYLECSKGTYVRQLASDIGDLLGCGACICQIERTKVGPFLLEESVTIEDCNESHIRDWKS